MTGSPEVSATGAGRRGTAFLDTNALMQLSLYWEACRHTKTDLQAQMDHVQFFATVEAACATNTELRTYQLDQPTRTAIRTGLRLFHNMFERKERWDFLTTNLCWAELRQNLFAAQIMERLSRARIPYRLQVKRPLQVFNRHLSPQDVEALGGLLDEFQAELDQKYGIIVTVAERIDGVTSDLIAATAEVIWTHVLMDVMDSYVYGASVLCMSEVLITGDGPLTGVVSQLWQPTSEEWKEVVASIGAKLEEVLGEKRFRLPQPKGIADDFPF